MKQQLLQELSYSLLKQHYTVKHFQGCFDVVARKGEQILLLKVVEDANSVKEEVIKQLKNMAEGVGGVALILSEKAGQKLRDSVVYTRHGLYVVTLGTLQALLMEKYPFILSKASGLTAKIVAEELNKKLEETQMSLGNLSRRLGVSTRMVVKYQHGDAEISLQRALKLYNALGGEVFAPINIFVQEHVATKTQDSLFSAKYQDLGFATVETTKAPVDIIAKKNEEIILTQVGDRVNKQINALSHLVDAQDLVIFNKKKPRDIPALSKEEFMEFEGSKELLQFLKEFD